MKNKLFIILMLILTICVSTAYVTSIAYAESTNSEEAFSSDPTIVHLSDDYQGWNNSSRWYSQPLWYCDNNSYSPTSHDYKYCEYNTSVISNLPYYKVMATDSYETIELSQVETLSSPDNSETNSGVFVTFQSNNISYASGIYLNGDEYILGALTSELQIFGSTTKVGAGKVLYRQGALVNGGTWGGWSYADLGTNTSIYFPANVAVQLAVIYEVKEEKLHWYQSHKYYRCLGYYRFNTGVV
ncbi:MAG: hypothetical protein E7338_02225 [Clostridiales bacterium]|nr:hypothetical protein [Clostridiales bacterium]